MHERKMTSIMTVLKRTGKDLAGKVRGRGNGRGHHIPFIVTRVQESTIYFPAFKSAFITTVHTSHSLEPDLLKVQGPVPFSSISLVSVLVGL